MASGVVPRRWRWSSCGGDDLSKDRGKERSEKHERCNEVVVEREIAGFAHHAELGKK